MGTSDTSNYDATSDLIFAIASGEEPTRETFTTAETSFGPTRNRVGNAYPFIVDDARPRVNRATIVNRLLDWSDKARVAGRVRRAEHLVCLAWDAYDRVPC
jgi:hypothetical protein